jgi:hypothetical protein
MLLLAFMPFAAVRAYVAGDDTWLLWGRNGVIGWTVGWVVLTWTQAFLDGRRHGGAREGVRRLLGPGIGWRIPAALGLVLALEFRVQYLRTTPWDTPFTALVIGALVAMLGYSLIKDSLDLRREIAIGIIQTMLVLLLLSTVAFYLYETGAFPGVRR